MTGPRAEPPRPEPDDELDDELDELDAEAQWWPSPTRRLAWTVVLTLAATVLVFALIPATGQGDAPAAPAGPWPGRYLDWLWSLVTLGFLDGRDDPNARFTAIRTPYAVCLTIAVATAAQTLATIIAGAGLPVRAPRPPRAWLAAAAVAGIALLGWLSGTLAAAADWLNQAVGATVLPTVVVTPSVQGTEEPFRSTLALVHQLLFPALVVGLALAPGAAWWWRRRWPAIVRQQLGGAAGRSLRVLSELLPWFVVAALLVEIATSSFGASQLLFDRRVEQWFDDRPSNVATGLLLLALGVAAMRWVLDTIGRRLIEQPAAADELTEPDESAEVDEPEGDDESDEERPDDGGALEPAEPARVLWHRLRSDRTARVAAALLAAVAVAVCYSRLWFGVRPTDIVSTDAPLPPSARHWLGVDMLGHDQLVRMSAAAVGSAAIAAGAATIATVAGLVLLVLAAWLPRRSSLLIADLGAVVAVVWLLRSFGDPLFASMDVSVSRLELALALGVLGLPVTIRLMSYRWDGSIAPIAAAWLVTCSAAIAAESLATMLIVQIGLGQPTLGLSLAETVSGAFFIELVFSPPVPATWPWLWYPPAMLIAVLAVAFTLLAVVVLRGPTAEPRTPAPPVPERP